MPPFAQYFESQAKTNRDLAAEFLKYLRKRESRVCPPIHKKPNMNEIDTPVKTIKLAQQLEKTLTKVLRHLNTRATTDREADLLSFVSPLLQKQKQNEDYLKSQLTQQERAERQRQSNILTETPSTSAGR